jgi:UMF1 family MFS transporter
MNEATGAEAAGSAGETEGPRGSFAQKAAWVLYDVGNSGFGMTVAGVLFSVYFNRHLVPEHAGAAEGAQATEAVVRGVKIFGQVVPGDGVFAILAAMTALMVTFAAPVLGAMADVKGWTRRLLIIHATGGSLAAMLTAILSPGQWIMGAMIYVVAGYFFGASLAFYNAFLPRLAPPNMQGRLSGAGFAAGYVGGGVALIVGSWIGSKVGTPIGLAFGGVWWLVFSLPAFFLLPTIPPVEGAVVQGTLLGTALRRIGHTFRSIREYRVLFLFLAAYLMYQNGVDTLIQIAPAYASQVLVGASDEAVQRVFLLVQFVAFPGALLCGWLSDRVGNRRVIVATLLVWCVVCGLIPLTTSLGWFTAAACVIGLVLGGVQSSSRALMAQLAPKEILNEAFGFFSVSGKAISIFGPLVYAAIVSVFGSRFGVLGVLPFMIAGLFVLLLYVPGGHSTSAARSGRSKVSVGLPRV